VVDQKIHFSYNTGILTKEIQIMFKNRSIEFQAAVKTVGVMVFAVVCGAVAAGVVQVFGITALLVGIMALLAWQLGDMVYHSYCITLRQAQRDQKTIDQ
jgi:fatty acid desaturase